jgi:prephenate dehydrogenase
VALISHLPHLVAATLAQLIGEESPEVLEFSGPGFRDTTRVASGPPEMWTEILQNNAPAVQKSTEAMIEKLREIATLLDRDCPDRDHRMNEFLTQAKAHRDRVRPPQK